jgi:hypothetical protein
MNGYLRCAIDLSPAVARLDGAPYSPLHDSIFCAQKRRPVGRALRGYHFHFATIFPLPLGRSTGQFIFRSGHICIGDHAYMMLQFGVHLSFAV